MIMNERIKFQRYNPETEKMEKWTTIVSGRTREELDTRIAKVIKKQCARGAEVRF